MNGPWYTVNEALEVLGLKYSELLYHIEQDDIGTCLYTKDRKMTSVRFQPNDNPIGYATLWYKGHLRCGNPRTLQLLEDVKLPTPLYCQILEPKKIYHWNTAYPYKTPLPNSLLADWRKAKDSGKFKNSIVIPYSEEKESGYKFFSDLLSDTSSVLKEAMSDSLSTLAAAAEKEPHTFSLREFGQWSKDDIRIAKSEIDQFLKNLENSQNQAEPPQKTPKIKEEYKPQKIGENVSKNGSRTTLLHDLMLRVMRENPEIKARPLWKLLQADNEKITPTYDTDNIIRAIDAFELSWESPYDNLLSFKFSSLSSRISRLKKLL